MWYIREIYDFDGNNIQSCMVGTKGIRFLVSDGTNKKIVTEEELFYLSYIGKFRGSYYRCISDDEFYLLRMVACDKFSGYVEGALVVGSFVYNGADIIFLNGLQMFLYDFLVQNSDGRKLSVYSTYDNMTYIFTFADGMDKWLVKRYMKGA